MSAFNNIRDYDDYYTLSEKFRFALRDLTDDDSNEMNTRVLFYSKIKTFSELFEMYFDYHYSIPDANEIMNVRMEYCIILAILTKIKCIGVENISSHFLSKYGRLIDDWYIRDGIVQAYDIAFAIYDNEMKKADLCGDD